MERVPGAKAQIRKTAQATANPEIKIVAPRVRVVWAPAEEGAGEKAKVQATARVKDENRDRTGGGRPEYFHGSNLSRMQHWEAA